jgi:hypothetical protein
MLAGITGAADEVPGLIAAPTLVLTGSRDGTRTPAAVAEFMAQQPRWRHGRIPGAGHMVHWEQPAACAAAILAHVAQAERQQRGPARAAAAGCAYGLRAERACFRDHGHDPGGRQLD